ncbi:MAG: tyrosine-type recombinase/integrase [Limisphaerales bacterium]
MKRKAAAPGKPVTVSFGAFTARIYSTPVRGSPRFTLAWSDPVRGRIRKTFATFEAAKSEAERTANAFLRGDTEAAGFTGADRARFAAVLETVRPTGIPVEVAVAQFAEAHAILGGRSVVDAARDFARRHRLDLPAVPVADAVAAFVEDRAKAGASKRYLQDLRTRLVHGFASANGVNLGDLTPDRVREWLDGAGGGPRHHNNNLAAVRTLVRFCIGRRWLPKDVDLLEGVTKRKADAEAIEIWTPEEMAALLANCPTVAVPAMAISAFAGLRNAEVTRLDWKEVRLNDGFIEVPAMKAKTASRRLAPCPANLVAWLTPHAKSAGPVWPHHNNTTHRAYGEAAQAAGLTWRENALRHSFVSYRLAEIQDVARVALEAGNSPGMIFAHYRELVRPADAKRWFAIRPGKDSRPTQQEDAISRENSA